MDKKSSSTSPHHTNGLHPTLRKLDESWPSAIVARNEVEKFTGGLIKARYIANLDNQGVGPDGRFKCGGKTGYDKQSLLVWLDGRIHGTEQSTL